MDDIKKSLKICFGIQGIIVVILILGAVLQLFGIGTPRLALWQITLIFFFNWFWCGNYLDKRFRKELQRISPETYNKFYGDPWFHNSLGYLLFVFGTDNPDSHDLKKFRRYSKYTYLLCIIIFYQTLFWVLIYVW